jgi:hypothetical protein
MPTVGMQPNAVETEWNKNDCPLVTFPVNNLLQNN